MRTLVLTGLSLIMLACSPVAGDAAGPDVMPVKPDGTLGIGIDRPLLQTMTYEEYSGPIEVGMSCSFMTETDLAPLFVATAEDNRESVGRAAMKINDTIVVLAHNGRGIAQVEEGGVFSTEALEITIEHPGGEPSSEKEETYFWPATLKITQDEGGSNMYQGIYECGA